MSYIASRDYDLWMAEQIIFGTYGDTVSIASKKKTLLKFGKITDLAATTRTTIASLGSGVLNEVYVASDLITHVASSSGSDTGTMKVEGHTVAGTGTSAVFTFVVQTVTLAGQAKTILPTPLARVSRAYNNTATPWVGDIYVAQDVTFTLGVPQTANAIHMKVPAGEQQSFKAATTISGTDYYIITSMDVSVAKKTNAVVDFRLEIREVGGVFRPSLFSTCSQGDSKGVSLNPPVIVPKNADVRITALASATAVEAEAWINGYLASVVS